MPFHCKDLRGREVRLASMLLLVLAAACGDDDYAPYAYIGNECREDFDCAPGIDCETGGDFPGGTCTVPCRDHVDCPRGTACVDVHGGVCLVYCSGEQYCRVGYNCESRHDRRGGGESFVCIR